jgi:hypothetical protein
MICLFVDSVIFGAPDASLGKVIVSSLPRFGKPEMQVF